MECSSKYLHFERVWDPRDGGVECQGRGWRMECGGVVPGAGGTH